jgi:DNA-binding GntR family transcriptional regulator
MTMIPKLDRTGPVPIYQQIQQWMREQITSGEWPEHYKLISEVDMAAQLDVNRGTLRNAISGLIKEGLLIRIHGKGTFVASETVAQPLAESLITFTEGFSAQHISFTTAVVEQHTLVPGAAIRSLLSINAQDEVFFLKRVRYVRGEPLILLENYVTHTYCEGIETVDFTKHSLFDTLENQFNVTLDWGRRFFQAQVADNVVADALGIAVCDPVMYVQQIVYQPNGTAIEMSKMWIRGSQFQVSALVKRGSKTSQLNVLQNVQEIYK